ncbi:hypothetical protein PLESTB_000270600 [Pleodorina starrii]|uniref:Inward rectifier potassium channel C-terminal domain-containing protein n=1 Tax=Pleodorina starrii TaxID=330485 RepID=A0A9W6BDB4_9CHLO|nr:hypothetical protein PLESTM_000685300 [Pleodorina starrii]GLC49643.1 hypothetical protein PLESTB_000270600 [Pleodorina starrii]GLC65584.1 hypothetical protein PLESTF_000315500 [Pleodorina starrii]
MPSSSPGQDRFMRMRSDGESLLSGAARRLSRIKMSFKTPSLLDRSAPYFSGVKRFGISKFQHYWQDPFHTLLNLPWGRFIAIFFATYMVEFLVFALIFWVQSDGCIEGKNGKFSHALWMSSRTASTLGFNAIQPNPECTFTNLMVMCQVIASSLVNFIMLGLVFARFSAPFKRASTIRFSSVMVCYQQPGSGHWVLSLRVANIRKHQLLKPALRMVLTAVDSITPSNYLFEHLTIDGHNTQETNLELGFPANVTHVITPSSPLYNLSLLEMDTRMMEVLVFVDGIDAMTSKNMSARHAYSTNEIHMNEVFQPLHLEMRGGSLGLDFSGFDLTTLASTELLSEYNSEPGLAERPLPEVQSHMWHLRHMTFKRLTEREHGHHHNMHGGDRAGLQNSQAGASGPGGAGLPPTHGSPYRSHPSISASSRLMDGAGGVSSAGGGGGSGAGGPSSNPFLAGSAGGGGSAASAIGASAGGGSSWMGFGVTLQPTASAAGAGVPSGGPTAAAGAQLSSSAAPGQQPLVPLSAFINSGQSGLESFADMVPMPMPLPHAHTHSHSHPHHQQGNLFGAPSLHPQHPHPQQQLPEQQQQLQHQRVAARGLGQQPGPGGGGGGVALEMLPTSLPAVEQPRVNGMGGGR